MQTPILPVQVADLALPPSERFGLTARVVGSWGDEQRWTGAFEVRVRGEGEEIGVGRCQLLEVGFDQSLSEKENQT